MGCPGRQARRTLRRLHIRADPVENCGNDRPSGSARGPSRWLGRSFEPSKGHQFALPAQYRGSMVTSERPAASTRHQQLPTAIQIGMRCLVLNSFRTGPRPLRAENLPPTRPGRTCGDGRLQHGSPPVLLVAGRQGQHHQRTQYHRDGNHLAPFISGRFSFGTDWSGDS